MGSARPLVSDNDQQALRALLERTVADLCGPHATLAGIGRARSAAASSYAAEIVTVELTTGDTLSFFLKDFGSTCIPKDEPQQRRERELAVYRDLLSAQDLGTARYFGSVWEPVRGRFWLLLELVPGRPVRECTLDAWIAAAAWLGRLQGLCARHLDRGPGADRLLRYDDAFLWSRTELAARHVGGVSLPLAKQLGTSLQRYGRVVPAMVAGPPTLVHGHYRPYNVLIDASSEPPRICPVDWERAGLGPPAYDFAYLAEGFDPQRLDLLGEAYRAEAARYGLSVADPEALRYLANAFRVHRMLSLLGSAVERRFTEAEVAGLVTLVSDLCDRL